eukprot:7126613-Pyramimonas_sp.AAC.1
MLGPVKRSKSSAQFKMGRAQDYAVTDLGFVPNSRVSVLSRDSYCSSDLLSLLSEEGCWAEEEEEED